MNLKQPPQNTGAASTPSMFSDIFLYRNAVVELSQPDVPGVVQPTGEGWATFPVSSKHTWKPKAAAQEEAHAGVESTVLCYCKYL